MSLTKQKRVLSVLCLIYGIWHLGTTWTTTLLSFLQWDTTEVLTIVDLGYIQSFGALCNAVGALAIGQMTDSIGPKFMFLFATVLTSLYYIGLSMSYTWLGFLMLQVLRIGYQLDSTAEMYLATVTTESERTRALMILTIPQAASMFLGPIIASRVAVWTTLRTSQFFCGLVMSAFLVPVLLFMLPTTHSIPRLASARLRPQDYWPMLTRNGALREGLVLRALLVAAYVCYELIARNYLLRSYMKGAGDSAEVLIVMGISLLATQFAILPILQKRFTPKTLLQIAITALIISYAGANFTTSLYQFLAITALQTGAYAVAYAESCTQITSAVERTDLGKATGFASMTQWLTHFVIPLYTSHLVQHWHYTYAFYTSAVLMTAALGYVTAFAKHSNARYQTLLPSMQVA
uniref:MFS domain-containing protein n=1 Tax=Panagrellus redivivus TaxID=6233 RepID=A0A7E4WB93_PANRE